MAKISRRVFVTGLLCAGCGSEPGKKARKKREDEDSPAPSVIDTGHGDLVFSLDEYPDLAEVGGTALAWLEGQGPVLVVRASQTEFVAILDFCTHKACPVNYRKGSRDFWCPCHGSRFDLEGKVLEGPAEIPLQIYTVSFDGDVVRVHPDHD